MYHLVTIQGPDQIALSWGGYYSLQSTSLWFVIYLMLSWAFWDAASQKPYDKSNNCLTSLTCWIRLALPGTSLLALCFWWLVRSWRWVIPQQWGKSWVSMPSPWCLVWCCTACSSYLPCTSSSPKRAPSFTYGESSKPCSSPWRPLPGKGIVSETLLLKAYKTYWE